MSGICPCGEPLAKYAVKASAKGVKAAGACAACGFKAAIDTTG